MKFESKKNNMKIIFVSLEARSEWILNNFSRALMNQ